MTTLAAPNSLAAGRGVGFVLIRNGALRGSICGNNRDTCVCARGIGGSDQSWASAMRMILDCIRACEESNVFGLRVCGWNFGRVRFFDTEIDG